MNEISCSAEGCTAVFRTDDIITDQTEYTCVLHTRQSPDAVRFQNCQFDKDLRRSSKPVGTNHIPFQGNEIRPVIEDKDELILE